MSELSVEMALEINDVTQRAGLASAVPNALRVLAAEVRRLQDGTCKEVV